MKWLNQKPGPLVIRIMNEKTLKLLEFDVILNRVAACSMSEEAAGLILSEAPLRDSMEARRLKELVAAFLKRMHSGDEEIRESLPAINALFPKLDLAGMVLEIEEIYALAVFMERGETLKNWTGKTSTVPGETNPLEQISKELPDTGSICAEIFRIIDREGKLRDLPVFQASRRRIKALTKDLESSGTRYTSNEETRRMLQSMIPSQRDGRMVLAVKANFRGRIKGIVHEVSASGQTLFIEPEEVVEKNNELLIEKRRLDAEIRRVLRELTGRIAQEKETIKLFHQGVIYLETLRARARYGLETRGVFAYESESIALRKARHPLLGTKAIPLDFTLEENKRTVIITGPNTGGKTVALKTAGLLSMMNQFGLPLPVEQGTTLPFFDGIYSDIGDEQSISQSLSTFSSHMTNIADILSMADKDSLILLDELGSGTDPEEGSAIAMALIDHLMEIDARLVITTHHGILKNYGYTRKGADNASMEFDGKTLAPTFRIIMGIPGESRALDIAERNGLPKEVVSGARKYLEDEQADISALIEGLRIKHRELDAARDEGRLIEEQLKEERRKADLKELRLRQKELQLKQESSNNLHILLENSRKQLENLVRELKEGEITREKTLKVKEFLSNLENSVKSGKEGLKKEEQALREERRRMENQGREDLAAGEGRKGVFEPGMDVLAGESRLGGRIVRQDKKGSARWIVEIGSMKMSFDETELIQASPMQKKEPQKTAASWAAELGPAEPVQFELKLLGLRHEEAMLALRRQIDAAALSGLREFSVVHGKGDGILQNAVHEYLKAEKTVASFNFSRPELGGFGRTEVVLNI